MPLWIVGLAAFLLSLIGAYAVGRAEGQQLAEAAAAREERIGALAAQQAASASARAIAEMKVQHVVVRQQVEKAVREVPVYRDCHHSPDGLRGVNAALEGTPAQPAGRGLVPPADALGR